MSGSENTLRVPKRRMSASARRTRILDAALQSFAGGGYGATGLAAIASVAGVTRAVLYDHFPSKRALYLAVLEAQNEAFMVHVGSRMTGDGPAQARMRATMEAVFAFAREHPEAWRLLFSEVPHGDGDLDQAWRTLRDARSRAVSLLLARDAAAVGILIDEDRAQIMVEMLVGALIGAVSWWRVHPDTPQTTLVDAGIDLLWTGLGLGPGAEASG